jgi:hypothetical protein
MGQEKTKPKGFIENIQRIERVEEGSALHFEKLHLNLGMIVSSSLC